MLGKNNHALVGWGFRPNPDQKKTQGKRDRNAPVNPRGPARKTVQNIRTIMLAVAKEGKNFEGSSRTLKDLFRKYVGCSIEAFAAKDTDEQFEIGTNFFEQHFSLMEPSGK